AYYAGLEHEPFRVGGGNSREPLDNLSRHRDVTLGRLESRKDLLRAFDTLRRDLDGKGAMTGIDAFQARALQMIASGKVRDAAAPRAGPATPRARGGGGGPQAPPPPGPGFSAGRRPRGGGGGGGAGVRLRPGPRAPPPPQLHHPPRAAAAAGPGAERLDRGP